GMLRDIANGRPFKRFRPTNFFLGLYDRTKDARYDAQFQRVWYANNAATIPKYANGTPKFQVGDTAVFVATADSDTVRVPGPIPGHETEMDLAIGQLTLDEVLNERARELAGESMRWFDLVRTHKLVERVKLYNPDGGANVRAFHALRPIPQTQIDRTTTPFPQNPGY